MAKPRDQSQGDQDEYYLARVGAEKAWRGMRQRQALPDGLRQAAGLAEQLKAGKSEFSTSYFREMREFLRARADAAQERPKK